MNRSIQAEGSFAEVKQDMEFRRYLYRGTENVTAQSVILAIAHNINKLHHKIQGDRTGKYLFALKKQSENLTVQKKKQMSSLRNVKGWISALFRQKTKSFPQNKAENAHKDAVASMI